MKKQSKVLYLKVGKVEKIPLEDTKRKELISAIKKYPIKKAFLTKIGFKEDEQADLVHHGGENKALFLFSKKTYEKISKECNINFEIDEMAYFGENLILSNVSEEDICIGDIYEIGESQIQITQPRQPCWKLSANTNQKQMTKFIFDSGYTGKFKSFSLPDEFIEHGNTEILLSKYGLDSNTIHKNIIECIRYNEGYEEIS